MKVLFALCALVYTAALLLFPAQAANAALDGMALWAQKVVPGLLPFFVGACLLEKSGLPQWSGKYLETAGRRLLKCPGCGFSAVLLSYTAGFPSGAKIIGSLYAQGQLSKKQAENACICACVSSPGFVLASAGAMMLGSVESGVILLCAHLLSALVNGALFACKTRYEPAAHSPHGTVNSISAPKALTDSLAQGGAAMINIGATIVFFIVVNRVFFHGNIAASCILEMTAGCGLVAQTTLPSALKLPLLCAVISFGGLSVQFQSLPYLGGCITLLKYCLAKASHAAIAFLLCSILVRVFPGVVPAFSTPYIPACIARAPLWFLCGSFSLFLFSRCIAYRRS